MVVSERQRILLTVMIDYEPQAYAKHLGVDVMVDRDLPMRVAQSLQTVLEDPSWDVPRGTKVAVRDWWQPAQWSTS